MQLSPLQIHIINLVKDKKRPFNDALPFPSGLTSAAIKGLFILSSVSTHEPTAHANMLKMSSSTPHVRHIALTHQSGLAKQQLHGSLAGTPPRGWAHLVQDFSHRKVVPGCDSIIAACLLDQL